MSKPILPDHFLKRMSPEDRKSLGRAGVLASEAAARCADKSEKAMQAEIQAYCDLRGWPCYRARMDQKSTLPNGTPDFLIALPIELVNGIKLARFVAIECKMPGNKPSDAQTEQLARIQQSGGVALLRYSSKDAIDDLKQLAGDDL